MSDRLALVKSEWIDDWWLIERAEHDGRTWLEVDADGDTHFRHSSRVGDADVEGTGEEMLALAQAIRARGSYSARRCAVAVDERRGHAAFGSPRNGRVDGVVSLASADALAEEIFTKLGGGK